MDLEHTEMAELDALLDDIAARAQGALPRPLGSLSEDQQILLALYGSTFEVYLGIRALLKERLSEEARMLSRPLLEDTARLAYFASSPNHLEEFILRFRHDSLSHEEWLNKVAKENDEPWADHGLARIEEERAAIEKAAEDASIALEPLPRPRRMLKDLGQPKLYYWHVRASNTLHSSVIGISSRFYQSEDGSTITIPLKGTDKEVAQVGVMAMQALTFAAVSFTKLIAPERRQEFVEYRERVIQLTNDLYSGIGLGILVRDQFPE